MRPATASVLPRRSRLLGGLAIALAGPALLCMLAATTSLEEKPLQGTPFLLVVLLSTLVGGLVPGLVATGASFLGLSYFYLEPAHTITVTESTTVLLVTWLVTALVIAFLTRLEARALTSLRTTRQVMMSAFELGRIGAWELLPRAGSLLLTPEAERVLGYAPGQFDGRAASALALVHPDDVRRAQATFEHVERGAGEIALVLRVVRQDGELRWLEIQGAAVAGGERTARVLAGVVSDVTEVIQRETRQRFLAESSKELGASLDPAEIVDRIAELAVPELADWCAIELIGADGIRTVPVSTGVPATLDPDIVESVLHSGRAELRTGSSAAELVAREASPMPGAVIVAPLTAHGRPIGALTLVAEGERSFDAGDLAFAEEFVRHAAIALDNARLHEEQLKALAAAEEARARTARLQAVTDALSETMTRADVADVLMREGLVALRAQAGAVLVLSADGRSLDALDDAGYPAELTERWSRFDASTDGPAAEALRTRDLVVVESPEELVARWPGLGYTQSISGDCASLTAPLLVSDEAVGVLHMAFRQPRVFSEADRSFVKTLARQCAQALERAHLYEEELRAREQAERLAGNLRRLQKVIDATFLTGSLDELLHELLVRLRDAVESDTATILTVDPSGEALVVRDAIGFDEPIETRVPIGEGFAGRIAATKEHRVVDDISKIHVVSSYLRTSGLRSLAGVPLVADGRLIGVAHVGSKRMREFDREDVLLLRLVAARAAIAIDRTQVHEREHHAAEVFQRSLLPERLPAIDGMEIAARYVPGTIGYTVGGDWYDVFELEDGSVGLAVGDVVGHGVPAAATMGRLRTLLRAYGSEGFGPGEALARLNRQACEGGDETFATVVYAVIAPSRTRLRFATAGHPPVLVRGLDGTVDAIEGGRSLPIGAAEGTVYPEVELRLDPGVTLVLYTDGLVERRAESIDSGIERLMRLLGTTPGPLDRLADRVVEELESADHTDDVALLAVQLAPVTTPTFSLRFPAQPNALAPMRSSLRTWLEGHGARDDEIFDILVAVNEACSNAIEHPIGRARPDVMVNAHFADSEISIVIKDHGRWRPAGPRGDRGRGLEFMGALMENVDVRRSDDGTTVQLTRRLERTPR